MTKRIAAIVFIFICTSVASAILGGTVFQRTYDSGATSSNRVASTWGTAQNQAPPTASFKTKVDKKQETYEYGKKVEKRITEELVTPLPLESSKVNVDLDLQHRQKGLLWYSTYKVAFSGVYGFRNTSDKEQTINFDLQFPTSQAIYDNLSFVVDGNPVTITNHERAAHAEAQIPAGKVVQLFRGL